jgi:hypothetical protein
MSLTPCDTLSRLVKMAEERSDDDQFGFTFKPLGKRK